MILILSALKEEIKPVLKEMEVTETVNLRPAIFYRGSYLGKEIVIGHTGVGPDKMFRAASFCLKEYRPEFAVNGGYSGALTPNLTLADIIISETVLCEKDSAQLNETFYLDKLEDICKNNSIKYQKGSALTVEKAAITPHEKAYLGTKFGSISVDMESFGFAKAAKESNTPYIILRSVLDPMDMHLPVVNGLVSDNGTTSALGVAFNVITKPHKAIHFPQLEYCAREARKSFIKVLNEIIKS